MNVQLVSSASLIFPHSVRKELSLSLLLIIICFVPNLVHGFDGFSNQVEDLMGNLRDAVKTIGNFVGDDKKGCTFECPYGKMFIDCSIETYLL